MASVGGLTHTARSVPVLVGVGSGLACALLLSSYGAGGGGAVAWAGLLHAWIGSGALAAAWLAGAAGLGAALTPRGGAVWVAVERWRGSSGAWFVRAALGVAAMLWVAMLLGFAGAYAGGLALAGRAGAMVVAWAPVAIGIALVLRELTRSADGERGVTTAEPGPTASGAPAPAARGRRWLWGERIARVLLAAVVGVGAGAMLTAAAVPPGLLWASEGGCYDTLSYHLQLPKEWLALGRVRPVEHNVYSWLPGAVESAFAQAGAMAGRAGPDHLLGGNGGGAAVIAAHMLHAGLTLLAAWGAGTLAGRSAAARLAAAAVVLATPWVWVVGSSAYNETAVVLMLAAATSVALTPGLGAARAGLVCGVLVGAAVSAKPTAAYLVAPGVGLVMALGRPRRAWGRAAIGAVGGGLVLVGPWVVRNSLASGNPVFPAGTRVFGSAHWSAEQLARWDAAHSLDLGPVGRLARLADPAFGLTHPQWGAVGVAGVVLVAAAAALACRGVRRSDGAAGGRGDRDRVLAWACGGVLVLQLLGWLTIGHLQSRFLLPTVGVVAVSAGLLAGRRGRAGVIGAWAAAAVAAASVGLGVRGVLAESSGGRIAGGLAAGVGALNGSALGGLARDDRRAAAANAGAAAALNLAVLRADPSARVAAIGEAAVLYADAVHDRLLAATTWDVGPFERAIALATAPGEPVDPRRVLDRLREDLGVTHLWIDFGELRRLERSGYLPPTVTERRAAELLDHSLRVGARPVAVFGEGREVIVELPPPR